eukprot:TRINITY_DN49_c0_g1_i1.p1 TRINITY_DN49_c0_g1~~TRINITY_DN49_c0_g1_i1.p1  ORF type:complete len:1053 (-),score=230.78 TRINITY_DN49_c0_g1_i1:70-3228(-)
MDLINFEKLALYLENIDKKVNKHEVLLRENAEIRIVKENGVGDNEINRQQYVDQSLRIVSLEMEIENLKKQLSNNCVTTDQMGQLKEEVSRHIRSSIENQNEKFSEFDSRVSERFEKDLSQMCCWREEIQELMNEKFNIVTEDQIVVNDNIAEIQTIQSTHADELTELTDYFARIHDLEAQAGKQQVAIRDLNDQLVHTSNRLKETNDDLVQTKCNVEETSARVEMHQQHIHSINCDVEKSNQRIDSTNEILGPIPERICGLDIRIDNQRCEMNDMHSEMGRMNTEYLKLNTELKNRHEADVKRILKNVNQLEIDLSKMIDQLSKQLKLVENDLYQTKLNLNKLTEKLEDTNDILSKHKEEMHEICDRMDDISATVHLQNKSIDVIRNQQIERLRAIDGILKEQDDQMQKMRDLISQAQKSIRNMKNHFNMQLQEIVEDQTSVKTGLAESHDRVSHLSSKFGEWKDMYRTALGDWITPFRTFLDNFQKMSMLFPSASSGVLFKELDEIKALILFNPSSADSVVPWSLESNGLSDETDGALMSSFSNAMKHLIQISELAFVMFFKLNSDLPQIIRGVVEESGGMGFGMNFEDTGLDVSESETSESETESEEESDDSVVEEAETVPIAIEKTGSERGVEDGISRPVEDNSELPTGPWAVNSNGDLLSSARGPLPPIPKEDSVVPNNVPDSQASQVMVAMPLAPPFGEETNVPIATVMKPITGGSAVSPVEPSVMSIPVALLNSGEDCSHTQDQTLQTGIIPKASPILDNGFDATNSVILNIGQTKTVTEKEKQVLEKKREKEKRKEEREKRRKEKEKLRRKKEVSSRGHPSFGGLGNNLHGILNQWMCSVLSEEVRRFEKNSRGVIMVRNRMNNRFKQIVEEVFNKRKQELIPSNSFSRVSYVCVACNRPMSNVSENENGRPQIQNENEIQDSSGTAAAIDQKKMSISHSPDDHRIFRPRSPNRDSSPESNGRIRKSSSISTFNSNNSFVMRGGFKMPRPASSSGNRPPSAMKREDSPSFRPATTRPRTASSHGKISKLQNSHKSRKGRLPNIS